MIGMPKDKYSIIDEYEKRFGTNEELDVMVNVICPKCGKMKEMPVCKKMVIESPGQMIEYPVVKGQVCEHSFIVAIDINFVVR